MMMTMLMIAMIAAGVAYPMRVITEELLADMISFSEMPSLDVDVVRGFPTRACLVSDDYSISAALQLHGVNRFRLSVTDDCREGLAQFEFGFKAVCVMMMR